MKRLNALFAAVVMVLACVLPAWAAVASPPTFNKGDRYFPQRVIIGGKKFTSSGLLGPTLIFRPTTTDATTLDTTFTVTTPSAARTYTIPDAGASASFVMTEGAQTINGVKTFGTPIVSASINAAIKKKLITVPFRGLAVQALDDSTVFTQLVTPGRAGTLTQVSIAAITPPIGGTNTVAVLKNDTTAMLAANFDPTTLTTVVASKPALHGTAGNLAFTSTDTISIVWTAGVQTTDAVAPTVTLEVELTDL